MALIEGELLADYVIKEIDSVTNEYLIITSANVVSNDLAKEYKDKWQLAIATGINNYITNEFEYNVKTNGAVVIATTPPSSFAITNYYVDGIFETLGANALKEYIANIPYVIGDAAIANMTNLLTAILTWLSLSVLAVTGSITDTDKNPIKFLSAVTGPLTTIVYPNFIPSTLANNIIEETSKIEFVDENGKLTGKNYIDVWNVIGRYIYNGLSNNKATFTPVVGTADTTKIVNGTTYTAVTTIGTIDFN